ncbi:MAG: thioredoxin family protein, partial [Lachnospiraceae bacterium]|nr:thioredoxin family protein [Lachnospiraceae bacterium]
APIVEKLAEKYEGKMKVGKCNIDEENQLAVRYNVMSIPTMIIFSKGEKKEVIVGATSQNDLESIIEKFI